MSLAARTGVAAWVAAALCLSCAAAPTGRDRLAEAASAIERLSSLAYEYAYEGTGSAAGSFTGRVRLLRAEGETPVYWAELRPSPTWPSPLESGAPPPAAELPESPAAEPPAAEPPALILSGGGDYVAARDEALGRFNHGTVAGGSGHLVANAAFAIPAPFTDPQPFAAELASDLEIVSRETVGGVLCDVLRGRTTEFGSARVWWHIGVEDNLPRAFRWESDDGSGALAFEIRRLLVDPVLTSEQLAIRVDVTGKADGGVIDEDARRLEPGVPAPDWTLPTEAGSELRLSDLRGEVVVLNFWSTWCASCRDLAVRYGEVVRRLADPRISLLALNGWESAEAAPGRTLREWGVEATLLLHAERIAVDYKLVSPPALFVVDARGDLALVEGPAGGNPGLAADELERILRALLLDTP